MRKAMFFILFSVILIQSASAQTIKVRKLNDTIVSVNNTVMHKDSIGKIPVDPIDTMYSQIYFNCFSFLITDSIYYNFKILKILKFDHGYGLLLATEIDGRDCYAFTISMKEGKSNHRKIRKGRCYRMKLKRYFSEPLIRSIEYTHYHNVMLGVNHVGVLSVGSPYIFCSQNMKDLYYIDSAEVDKTERKILENTNEITLLAKDFIQSICFEEDSARLIEISDTALMKTSLKKYHELFGPNIFHGMFYPPTDVPLMEWDTSKIDTNKFNSFFWRMINDFYSLPIKKSENISFSKCDITIKILYLSDDIYTIRANWKLPSFKRSSTAFLSIKKFDNKYIVIGFNKVW
jgi:hypothetical protein